MKRSLIAAAIIGLSAAGAFAADDKNLTGKAMDEHPGTTGGATQAPTVKPDSGSLSEKQMQQQPGVNKDTTGVTANPTAQPADNALKAEGQATTKDKVE